ncbi:MAG: oligosaccharide flippase family protein [Thermoplasmata archaeon]|nr:oligosaccharide flippase family protein [Thermoplasmata archaeon]
MGAADGARAGLSSVTRGTLLMMLGTLGFVAESFVSRVILVRTLSPLLWSQFSLAIALGGLVTAFGALGLPSAIARSLPYESSDPERRRIVHTAYLIGGPAALTVAAALAVFSLPVSDTFHAPVFGLTLLFFSVAVAFNIIASLIASIFQGYEDVLPNALYIQVLNPALFIAFLLTAERLGPSSSTYEGVLIAYVVAAAASFVALVLYARRRLPVHLPSGPRTHGLSIKLLTFAAPLFLVGVLSYVAGNGDTLVLGAINRANVGYYSAELSLSRLLQVGIGSLGYIFLPVTARFVRTGNTPAVRVTYATATKWMVLLSMPLFLLFFFLPATSLAFVYGPAYVAPAIPLQLLVLGAFMSTLVGPSNVAQVAYGQTRLLFYNTAIAAGVDVILALWLTPLYGLTGAAVAWASASALLPALSMVELAVLNEVHPFDRNYVLPVLVTAVPVGIVLLFVPASLPLLALPLLGLGIAGLFVLAVVLSGSIDDGDRMLLEVVESILRRPVPLVRWLGRVSRRLHDRSPP